MGFERSSFSPQLCKLKVLVASEQQRRDVEVKRRWWRRWQSKPSPDQLVFLDETWAKTNMTRLRGRAPKGKRLIDHVPHGHWKTTTFLAGIRTHGWVAPLVIDGAINGKMFLAWVEQHLIKEWRARGDTHKSEAILPSLTLWLSPMSPMSGH